ncbi:lymphocyte antigen 6F [Mus caroli]|uniref:Lymphocyte antigen 6F n=1 Tax=Mus caroli TaxID=10089 RepID=A0A6P7QVU8_MUSCR|nr:lymphocyte antigen 6F [Mus caroli]
MDSCHTTNSCVLILLVVLLCAERAQGLECYNCLGVPLGMACKSITCPYPDAVCISQQVELIVDSQRRKVKNKLCFPFCPANLENMEILGTTVNVNTSCCKEDLCNAAISTGGSTWTMTGVLLLNLGLVFLQTLL